MLADLGHPFGRGEEVYDVTFENVQAGLRTDYLFRAANQRGGIVLGTGDLSELALGWCTYGVGDQMSHYGVNTGVPKTLMQHLIRWVVSSGQFEGPVNDTLLDDPRHRRSAPSWCPTKEGEKIQSTEDSDRPLRPAGLHALPRAAPRLPAEQDRLPRRARLGRRRARGVAGRLPRGGAAGSTTSPTIRRWMEVFVRRFFANQFKRSAIPNGPEGRRRRLAVAARRLADAVRRGGRRLARRARRQRPEA